MDHKRAHHHMKIAFIDNFKTMVFLILVLLLLSLSFFYLSLRPSLFQEIFEYGFIIGLFVIIVLQSFYIFSFRKKVTDSPKKIMTYEQLESFISNTSDAFDVVDLNGFTLKVNKAFEEMFGWSEEELIGKKLPIIPDHLMDQVTQYHKEVMSGKIVTAYETVRQHKNGKLMEVSILITPIKDKKDNIVALAAILRDITERKKMENTLWETTQSLQSIIHSSPMAIIVLDSNANVKLWNKAAECIFGWTEKEVLNRHIPIIPNEKISEFKALFQEEIHGLKLTGKEVCRQRKDGTLVDISVWSAPLYDLQGHVTGIMTLIADISDRRITEELLKKSDKLSAVGQLAAGVAHEIRNPLTTLKGFLQLNQYNIEKNHHQIMLSELERINFIVSEFLVLSKPQAIHYQPKNILQILDHVIAIFYPQTNLKNIQIVTEYESDTVLVYCEENQLKQVFINILKNATEAMQKGGNININVQKTNDQHVSICIADQGCGIPEENITRLGEPFYSTKSDGTGLGLMVTYKIIKDHQGRIIIQSRPGLGTTVEIFLPLYKRK